jgi:hypothetical protein
LIFGAGVLSGVGAFSGPHFIVMAGDSGSATVVSRTSTDLGFAAATAAIARGFVNGMTFGGGVLAFGILDGKLGCACPRRS